MTSYTRINRKFEQLFHRRVKKTIDNKIDSLISVIEGSGLNAGITQLNNSLVNPDLVTEIRRLYRVVGVRHADETTRKLRAVQGWRPLKKSYQVKGFGFNETWIEFIENYLRFQDKGNKPGGSRKPCSIKRHYNRFRRYVYRPTKR